MQNKNEESLFKNSLNILKRDLFALAICTRRYQYFMGCPLFMHGEQISMMGVGGGSCFCLRLLNRQGGGHNLLAAIKVKMCAIWQIIWKMFAISQIIWKMCPISQTICKCLQYHRSHENCLQYHISDHMENMSKITDHMENVSNIPDHMEKVSNKTDHMENHRSHRNKVTFTL